jgi:starch synthase
MFTVTKKKKLNILFVGSEAVPFVKVGGLAEILSTLPLALRDLDYDVRVMIPKYAIIDEKEFPMETIVHQLEVPNKTDEAIICNIKEYVSDNGMVNYFLENQEFFEKRGSVYGYDDDPSRWALLARGAIEFVRTYEKWRPSIIVANDWQGGLIPNYMQTEYKDDPVMREIASVFVIHNIYYQGILNHKHISELEYDDGQTIIPAISDPAICKLNFMRRGIRYADVINTVSPTYAREITTPEYGELLDPLLQERRSRLFGILNGLNYDIYNPETNPYVEYPYTEKNLSERKKNKKILQQKFNLDGRPDVFVVAIISRLTKQKGLDLVLETIEPLLDNYDFQFIVLGSGDSKYMSFFEELDKKYPQVATHLSFDTILPHSIYAGADAILIPSKFEPSGLTQMEAMRYGAIPIARKIGGLADSIEDYDPVAKSGTGFLFDKYDPYAFFGAFIRAHETHKHKNHWQDIQHHAMQANFSWEKSAKEYAKLFERARNQFNQ